MVFGSAVACIRSCGSFSSLLLRYRMTLSRKTDGFFFLTFRSNE